MIFSVAAGGGALGVVASVGTGEEWPDRSLSYAARSYVSLRDMLQQTKALTPNPIAVNIMCALTNYADLVQAARDVGVPLHIPDVGHALAHRPILLRVLGLPGGQTVHVAVVHAERGRDQDGVVDFLVGGARRSCPRHILGRDVLPALLHLSGNRQECLELGRDVGRVDVRLDLLNPREFRPEVRRRRGPVRQRAEAAVVARRHVRRDELALRGRQAVRSPEQHLGQLTHGPGRLRADGKRPHDPRQSLRQRDMRHQ